jgi:hypothetical protein
MSESPSFLIARNPDAQTGEALAIRVHHPAWRPRGHLLVNAQGGRHGASGRAHYDPPRGRGCHPGYRRGHPAAVPLSLRSPAHHDPARRAPRRRLRRDGRRWQHPRHRRAEDGARGRKPAQDLSPPLNSGTLAFELAKLAQAPRAALLVEGCYSALVKHHCAPEGFLPDVLACLQVRYPEIPIVLAETRPLAEEWTYRYLAAARAELAGPGGGAARSTGAAHAGAAHAGGADAGGGVRYPSTIGFTSRISRSIVSRSNGAGISPTTVLKPIA